MTVQKIWGGPDDGAVSGEVDDGTGSSKNLGGQFWQFDEVSENLWGLGLQRSCNGLFIGNPHQ
jgi:hypothetical protein